MATPRAPAARHRAPPARAMRLAAPRPAPSRARVVACAGRNIVVAVDESEDATRAVAWAASHLFRDGDTLHLLHVVPKAAAPAAPSGALYYAPPPPETAEDELAAAAESFIRDHFLGAAELRGLPAGAVVVDLVKERVCANSVAAAITKHADALDAAAVVLLAHSRSRVQELVWGSVSKAVTASTRRPVVLVH